VPELDFCVTAGSRDWRRAWLLLALGAASCIWSASPRDDTGHTGDAGACAERTPGAVSGPDCVSGSIACGESVEGTTAGGTSVFDAKNYQAWYCLVSAGGYDGAERVFSFVQPADSVATITLRSPCADLDLFVMAWNEADRCPSDETILSTCEVDDAAGGGVVTDLWSSHETRYLVVVDGKTSDEDNFELSVSCETR
jgi:hypothetical protein